MRYTDDDKKTIRQIIGESLRAVENELSLIREVLETMQKQNLGGGGQRELLSYQVSILAEQIHELEVRVISLEKRVSWESWLFRQTVSLVIVLVIVLVVNWFV